jgi:hypothetical protein
MALSYGNGALGPTADAALITTAAEQAQSAINTAQSAATIGSNNALAITALQERVNTTNVVLQTSTTDADQIVDTVDPTVVRTIKYTMSISSGEDVQAMEILMTQDGSNIPLVVYSPIMNDVSLVTFSTIIDEAGWHLTATPVNAVTMIKGVRLAIDV